jgi:hypothetical protein
MCVIQLFYSATSIATDMQHEMRYGRIYIKCRLGGMRQETVVDSFNQHLCEERDENNKKLSYGNQSPMNKEPFLRGIRLS